MPSTAIDHHHQYRLPSGGCGGAASPSLLEIRLFYVRISPCSISTVPPSLTLSLSIDGGKSSAELRRDRIDLDSGEVTYVTTKSLKIAFAMEFEVVDTKSNLILCGSLERLEAAWSNGSTRGGSNRDSGWSMDCHVAASVASLGLVRPNMGTVNPSVEVYVAGCFGGVPLILTQTVLTGPRRKTERPGALDSIPEDGGKRNAEWLTCQRIVAPVGEGENEDGYNSDTKVGPRYYPEGWYVDEDGQLSWFNAGVRVGVGIGLGMCVGLGIGVGLLMRSYQATTRSFKRRFF